MRAVQANLHIASLVTHGYRAWLVLCLTLGFSSIGCGSYTGDRVDVTGRVTYAGQPVPVGRIDFVPGPDHPGGAGDYAAIKDGKFSTRTDGRGPSPGDYLVRIDGFDNKPPQVEEVLFGNPLFPTYETEIVIHDGQEEVLFEVPERRRH